MVGYLQLTGNERPQGGEKKPHLECICTLCGSTIWVKYSDLKKDAENRNKRRACKSCASKMKMSAMAKTDKWKNHQAKMVQRAVETNTKNREVFYNKVVVNYDKTKFDEVRLIMVGAKDRCCNKDSNVYHNYGGRGITFGFDSPLDAAVWIVNTIGYRPSAGHSIDRVNNNKGYEPGNLRWATRLEQANNKRQYRRTPKGERIRMLQEKTSYSYESLRCFIDEGLTDEQIIKKQKYKPTTSV